MLTIEKARLLVALSWIALIGFVIYKIWENKEFHKRFHRKVTNRTKQVIGEEPDDAPYDLSKNAQKYGRSIPENNYIEYQVPTYLRYMFPDMITWKFYKYMPSYSINKNPDRVSVIREDGITTEEFINSYDVKWAVTMDSENNPILHKARYWFVKNDKGNAFGNELKAHRSAGNENIKIDIPTDFSKEDVEEFAYILSHKYPLLAISTQTQSYVTVYFNFDSSKSNFVKSKVRSVTGELKELTVKARSGESAVHELETYVEQLMEETGNIDIPKTAYEVMKLSVDSHFVNVIEQLKYDKDDYYRKVINNLARGKEVEEKYLFDGVYPFIEALVEAILILAKKGLDRAWYIGCLIDSGYITDEIYDCALSVDNAECEFALGMKYYKKEDVEFRDYERAFFLFTRAAKKQHAPATGLLGECYEVGNGTKINYQKAGDLYKRRIELAEDNGYYERKVDDLYVNKKWDKTKYNPEKLFATQSEPAVDIKEKLALIKDRVDNMAAKEDVTSADKISLLRKELENVVNLLVEIYLPEELNSDLLNKINSLQKLNVINEETANSMHNVRKTGNAALHNAEGEAVSESDYITVLKDFNYILSRINN